MPSLAAIRDVYARRGLRGVLRAGLRWWRRRVNRRRGGARAAPGTRSAPTSSQRAAASPVTVDLATARAWFEARRPTYEALVDAVAPHLPRDGLVLDVGANIGFFTVVLTERAGFRGTVHLFEPVPNLADLCAQTARTLPCTAVVHRVALGDETGTARIFVAGDGNLGWNTLVTEKAHPATMAALEIEVVRYGDLGLDAVPDLVKIDVEGAEYRVLRGLLPSIRLWPRRPLILCEIGWGPTHPAWSEQLVVFDRLIDLGYETRDLAGASLDVRTLTRTTDVLFVPVTSA